MKWRDIFRPKYLHNDPSIRREALKKIHDREELRRIYTKIGSDYKEIQLDIAFILKDKELLYDLITDSRYWYHTKWLSKDNIDTLLNLDFDEGKYLDMSDKTGSFDMQFTILIKIARFDRIRGIIDQVYGQMLDSRREILRREYNPEEHESKMMKCFSVLPDDMLDVKLLKIMSHAVLFNKTYHTKVFDKYLSAGWEKRIVKDLICKNCNGMKTVMGRFEEGSWEVACSSCNGTGYATPFARMTKGDEVWDDSPWGEHF